MASVTYSDMMVDEDYCPQNEELDHLNAALMHDNDDTTKLIIERNVYTNLEFIDFLTLAIKYDSIRCIKYLVEVKSLTIKGLGYLNGAISWKSVKAIEYLTEKGAD